MFFSSVSDVLLHKYPHKCLLQMQLDQHKLLCDTWEWEQATLGSKKNIIKVKVHPPHGLQSISNNNNSNDSSLSEINCTNSSVLRVHTYTSHKIESPKKMF